VDGTLSVDSVVSVGTGGQVRGEIRAKSITVAGQVIGNIIGVESVDIHASGKLEGDVKAPRVAVADGAYFKGRVEMTSEATRASEPSTQPVTKAVGATAPDSLPSPSPSATGKDGRPEARPSPETARDSLKASGSGK
jgi:cytoskeletal protein CcmA (bactofilin family)